MTSASDSNRPFDDGNFSSNPPPPQPLVEVHFPRSKPMVSWTLIGVTLFLYLLQMGSQALTGVDLLMVYGAKINSAILGGQVWRLITPVFLHGSILHIAFNMYALYAIGPTLENAYGHGRFALLYFLTGFSGNVMSFLLSANPSLGSSTAIFGLVAAEGVFIYQNKAYFGNRFRSAITNIVLIVVVNLLIGMNPGIDNWGHVGGLLGGLIFSWIAGPIWKISGMPPVLTVIDSRPANRVAQAALLVFLLFGGLTVVKFFLV